MSDSKSLEIVIPTYNHPEFIAYILEQYDKIFDSYPFIVSIHDSSTNNLTSDLIENHPKFNQKLFYFRYDPAMDVDEKTIRAIKRSTQDHAILCGDGWVINVKAIFESEYWKKDYDIILIYDRYVRVFADYYNRYIKQSEYYSAVDSEYLRKHFWHSTLYGASIISKKLYGCLDEEKMIEKYNRTNFIYPVSLVETASKINGDIFVTADHLLIRNKEKNYRKAAEQTDILKIWCQNYTIALEKLGDCIDKADVEYIIQTTGKRTGLLTANSLAGLKVVKQLNWKSYKKYKPYIIRTVSCKKGTLFMILLTPRCILFILKWMRRAIKKLAGKGLDYAEQQ